MLKSSDKILGWLRLAVAYLLLALGVAYVLALAIVLLPPLGILVVLARIFHPAWPVKQFGSEMLNDSQGGDDA